MLQQEAEKLAQQFNIDIAQIVREEWEIKILDKIFNSSLKDKLYLKGGTALRLSYNSPRYSEDLDFDLVKKLDENEFKRLIEKIARDLNIKISDLYSKFYTYLAEFKISEEFLPLNFSIKIEISKRNKKYRYSPALLTSPTTNIQVLAFVEKIEDILKDKIETFKNRLKARDLFDIWFISQKLRQPIPENLPKIPKQDIKKELSRFLPQNYQSVVKELEELYGL